MSILHFIIPPLLGGVIGFVTNDFAIRMLFRPFKPKFLGSFQLPFTPGLIPKEKPRIAKAIGKVIGANLLDTETLSKALASDKMKALFTRKIDEIIEKLRTDDRDIQEYIHSIGYEENVDKAVAYVGSNLGSYVAEKLVENQVGTVIFEYALQEMVQNLNPMFVVLAESAIEKSREGILDKIDELILEQAPGMIDGYLEKEYENLLQKPVNELALSLWQKKESLQERIWDIYLILLEKGAGSFLKNLDVATIVEDKIRDFDEEELERLIRDIADKELHALVWIGGFLGAIIGCVNIWI